MGQSKQSDKKSTLLGCLLLAGMLALICGGVYGVAQGLGTFWHAPTTVTCNGEPMSSYDRCEEVHSDGSPSGTEYTYQQQLDSELTDYNVYRYLTAAGILIVVVVGGAICLAMIRSRRRSSNDA